MKFHEKLTELMFAKRMTIHDLAKLAGVSHGAVHKWKTGKSMPYTRNYDSLAQALGVSVDELINCDTELKPVDKRVTTLDLNRAMAAQPISDTQALMALVADLAAQVATLNKQLNTRMDKSDALLLQIDKKVSRDPLPPSPPPPKPAEKFPNAGRHVPPPKVHKLA